MTRDPRATLAKLLEMAERGTDHEREIAAAKAAEWMARHQISSFDLASATGPAVEDGRVDSDDPSAPPARVENWNKMLLVVVAEAAGGRAWMQGKGRMQRMMIAGTSDSVASARYLYMWLARVVGRMAREAASDRRETNAWRRSYAVGAVAKLRVRLAAARQSVIQSESTALVVVDRVAAAVTEHMNRKRDMRPGRSGPLKRPDGSSWGYHDADQIDLADAGQRRVGAGLKGLPEPE